MKVVQMLFLSFLFSTMVFAQYKPRHGSKRDLKDKATMLYNGTQGFTDIIVKYLDRHNHYMDSAYQNKVEMKVFFKINEFIGSADAFWKVVHYTGRDYQAKEAIYEAYKNLTKASSKLHRLVDELNVSKGLLGYSSKLHQEVTNCIEFVEYKLSKSVHDFVNTRRGGGYGRHDRDGYSRSRGRRRR